jgi:hypothetical protein
MGLAPEKLLGPGIIDDWGELAQHALPEEVPPRRPQETSVAVRKTVTITIVITRAFFKNTSFFSCIAP